MNIKEPIQRFSPVQKIILAATVVVMVYGTYAYFIKLPDRTVFVKKMKTLMMSQEELDALEKAKEAAEDAAAEAEFENDDF